MTTPPRCCRVTGSRGLALGLALLAPALAGAEPPAPAAGVLRSSLFELDAGDRVEDAGVIEVTSARMARTEHFEVVRRADGGRTLTSVTLGAGGSYRVEGRWEYGPDDAAGPVRGLGVYDGTPVVIEISGGRPGARIDLVRGAERSSATADCAAGCLVDLAPSALPMFTMTRRYDAAAGGEQRFHWIGRSLTIDQVLLDGTADIRRIGSGRFGPDDEPVEQYAFVEKLKDEASGSVFEVAFNLYVGADQRPLGFAIAPTTVGERVGYEGLTDALPPRFPGAD